MYTVYIVVGILVTHFRQSAFWEISLQAVEITTTTATMRYRAPDYGAN
jgi:hypothetical protein